MTLTTRTGKGSALTHAEMDANWAHVVDSANSTFAPSGSGATTRTMQAKAREIVSITDFGATGDGSTSDSTAIQAATDALLAAGGGVVWSPAATSSYKINTGISLSFTADTEVNITFAGMSDRSRWTAGAAIDMLTFTSTVSNVRRVTVKDMMFNLNSTATAGIVFNNAAYDRVLDSQFVNGPASANFIELTGACKSIFISRNYFFDTGTGGSCVNVGGTSSKNIIANNFFGEDTSTGIDLSAGTSGNIIEHNVFNGVNTAVSATQSDRNTISSNVIDETDGHAILLTSCSNTQVRNNQVNDFGNDVGSWYGVFVTTASSTDGTGNVISGNTFTNGDVHHVRVASPSGSSINTVITGNYFDATVSSNAVNDAGTTSMVRENKGWVTEAFGTDSIPSGSTLRVVTHGLSATPTQFAIEFREQGTNDYGRYWISDVGATTFRVNVSADPGASNLDFTWAVFVR